MNNSVTNLSTNNESEQNKDKENQQDELELIVLKIGGSAITNKSGYMEVDNDAIDAISKAIANAKKQKKFRLIIVHGVGSFGHAPVMKYNINNGLYSKKDFMGMAITHNSVSKLSTIVCESLIANDLPAVMMTPINVIEQKSKQITSFYKTQLVNLLDEGFIPVLYGDMVYDSELKGSVISGDVIVPHIAKELGTGKLVYISNVDGIFTENPFINSNAKIIENITSENIDAVFQGLSGSNSTDVTGGMKGKITRMLEYFDSDLDMYVINGAHPKRLEDVLVTGKTYGTRIFT